MQGAVAAFQRHASAALLAGGTPRVANIAEAASRETLGVAHAVAWLEEHGQLECDGELLAGAHGLTRRTTSHTLTIGEPPCTPDAPTTLSPFPSPSVPRPGDHDPPRLPAVTYRRHRRRPPLPGWHAGAVDAHRALRARHRRLLPRRDGATPNACVHPAAVGLRGWGIVFAFYGGDMASGVPSVAGHLGVHLRHA
jgi:hypothetical protein